MTRGSFLTGCSIVIVGPSPLGLTPSPSREDNDERLSDEAPDPLSCSSEAPTFSFSFSSLPLGLDLARPDLEEVGLSVTLERLDELDGGLRSRRDIDDAGTTGFAAGGELSIVENIASVL